MSNEGEVMKDTKPEKKPDKVNSKGVPDSVKRKMDILKSVNSAIRQLEKQTKKEGLVYIHGDNEIKVVSVIPSGSLALDMALGVGGFPRGRIIELFGPESSGKTLIATKTAAECQKLDGVAAIVDMEHAFDPIFAAKLGLNVKEIIISQPDTLQEAFEVIDKLIDAGVDCIILDSVAALVPEEELNGEIGKVTVALVARYMSQFLRRVTPKCANNNTVLIMINQIRDTMDKYNPTTTPGGKLVA